MGSNHPRHATRRISLALLLSDPSIGGPTELARLLGKPKLKGHLSNIKSGKRGMGDELAKDIEHAAGKPGGWMDLQHSHAGENIPTYLVAQDLSHQKYSDDLPLMKWEDLMIARTVPDIFRAALPDDAMAPEFPKGTEVVWTTRRRVAPGRMMLLQDSHGQLHVRLCHQGRSPGHWVAAANNAAFLSFDSSEPGLRVLAVYKGRLEPDDE